MGPFIKIESSDLGLQKLHICPKVTGVWKNRKPESRIGTGMGTGTGTGTGNSNGTETAM